MRSILFLSLVLFFGGPVSSAESDRHQWIGVIDTSWLIANSELPSWLEHGSGKLRHDEGHDGIRVNRAFLDYRGRLTPTLFGHVTVNVNDDVAERIDLTEAFVEWRPLPRSAWRFRARGGAFYPRLSVENPDPGWSSPYGLTSSVINTWIGEELRTIGAEIRAIRHVPGFPDQQVSLEGAIFYANDPTGALLTWRGWAAHDRQTGLTGQIPMPAVSAIAAWVPAGNPTRDFEPFEEIDNRPGFYAGAQWRWGERALVKLFHYDNHANPEARSGAEYAWQTWFDHVAVKLSLPLEFGMLGQWISGSTRMGPDLGLWRVQDVDFDASYLTLTRKFGPHRFSVRHEWFDLQPFNDPAGITNQDKGNALAVSWLFAINKRLRLGAEYMQITSQHCTTETCFWVFNGNPRTTRETQVQLSLRWYLHGESPD